MRTMFVSENGTLRTHLEIGALDQALADSQNVVWLDIADPDDADMALLNTKFKFHPLAIEDAIRSHERPKVDAYTSYYFLVFYSATYQAQDTRIETQAINLFVGANYLVTVHPGKIAEIDETMARWSVAGSPLWGRVGVLVHALLDALVDAYFPIMDQVADRIEDLEDTIFINFDQDAIQTIFELKKDLLNMRRIVAPERDVMNVLLRRQLPVFGPEEVAYLQDVYDHIIRVTDSIDTYRDLLSSALDSFLSLQSNNLNQIMKLLTMVSIVLMSNALIAGIYGMNFQFMPELRWQFGYAWALGLMLVVSVGLVYYFRRKKWF